MYRWSQLFLPTLREAPADAEVASHKFLVRAGYIRQLAAGVYSYLFLAQRSLLKIMNITRQEMDKIGQEFYLPALHPGELWQATGRWEIMGETLFRLKDRAGRDLCLGPTHEEVMTEIARKELRSYKQLPQIWYQIQTKFRDEPRPKSGLLRVRQFIMKDSYSFDLDTAGLDVSYQKHYDAYCRIFDRCGLKYSIVEAHSGAMGGSQSHEFMVLSDAGEDLIATCEQCGYAANLEKAASKLEPVEELPDDGPPTPVHTPGQKTIEDVARFLGVSPKQKIKTLALMITETDGTGKTTNRPLVALVRGDHMLNEAKLTTAIEGKTYRPMHEEEIRQVFGSPAGFLGPVGMSQPKTKEDAPLLIADVALKGRRNLVAGANKEDYHLRHVTPERDFQVDRWADLRSVTEGEGCANCGSPLKVAKAVEIGHIFKLGYKYANALGAKVLDQDGKEVTLIMGSYGIGMERILTAAVEQNNDENGFALPPQIAPFEVVITPVSTQDAQQVQLAKDIQRQLVEAGFDVLLDDRDERPGVKFKDADLIGVPFRITVGRKASEGKVEVRRRSTGKTHDASISAIVRHMEELLRPLP
jgi:prolyl-tRNA synthetase